MKIHSAKIEGFKSIQQVEFTAHGNHVIISGVNGTGKTSVLESLNIIFGGKRLLPDDPIYHGKESAKFEWNFGEGNKIVYTFIASITKENFYLKFYQYLNGKRMELKGAANFVKSLVFNEALDPQSFFSKSDKEQVNALYEILPDLKAELDVIDKEYKQAQEDRSFVRREGETLKHELEAMEYYSDVSEKPVSVVELADKLKEANEHNAKLEKLEDFKALKSNALVDITKSLGCCKTDIENVKSAIENLKKELEVLQDSELDLSRDVAEAEKAYKESEQAVELFEKHDTAAIEEEISKVDETNKKIQNNKSYKELEEKITIKREEYSKGLEDMRKLEKDRVDLFASVKMPVEGLQVGEGCLLYPDPRTGELVRLKSLSTGQQWAVVVPILASFLPKEEDGLKTMVIHDLNALDDKNIEKLFEEADKAGVQLVIHETLKKSDDEQLTVTIK